MTANTDFLEAGLVGVLSFSFLSPSLPTVHILCGRVFFGNCGHATHLMTSFLFYLCSGIAVISYLNHFTLANIMVGFFTATIIFLVYSEAFSMICRGFSLRILVDVFLNQPVSLDGVIDSYGDHQGAKWMMKKRLAGLCRLGLVSQEEGVIYLRQPVGGAIAKISRLFKTLLKLGDGG
jgi:hypothetical protein